VLDVKTGSGAFLPDTGLAVELARTMIGLGEARGCRTVALLTAMDRPLGRACGNALEVEEAIEGLRGRGPSDLMEVTLALGAEMLVLVGVAPDLAEARARLERAVASGRALETFARLIEAQGGNPAVVDEPSVLPQADAVEVYRAERDGVVVQVEPRRIGRAVVALGGGRTTVDAAVDPTVGFVITVKPGDPVRAGEPIASVFARNAAGLMLGLDALRGAITIGDEGRLTPLIAHRITAAGVEAPPEPQQCRS
jgi:pyrimidine-nucleoside phosphorylase